MRRRLSLLLILSMVAALCLPGCGGGEPETLKAKNFEEWFAELSQSETKTHTYQLTEDVTLNKEIVIDGHDVTLDLAGHTITGEKIRAFSLTGGATLTLKGGTVETKGANENGGVIYLDSSYLHLDNMKVTNTDDSHIGELLGGGVIYAAGKEGGSVTLKGGSVITGSPSGIRRNGGAITMSGKTVLTIEDATVQNGKAGTAGNIQLEGNAVLNLEGGSILDGTAVRSSEVAGSGGNIGTQGLSQIHVRSGVISGGTAERTGGNIYLSNTAGDQSGLHLYGGLIENGKATTDGGNIFATEKYSVVRIFGGSIQNGNAARGGNVALQVGALEVWGGTMTGLDDNTMLVSGGNVYADSATVNIHAGTITRGFAQNYGGNIHIHSSTMNIYGGYITDGTLSAAEVSKGGGNIYAGGASFLNLYGGEISGGMTNCNQSQEDSAAGPNVMIGGSTFMQMFGGLIKDGKTFGKVTRGGGVYVYGQAARTTPVFYMYGGTIQNGALENTMRGMCVASYSGTNGSTGIGLARIFGGEIQYTGPKDNFTTYAIFGNATKGTDMYLYTFEQYKGFYARTTAKACPDATHNTVTGEQAATCEIHGAVIHECDTCGIWYEITTEPLGHTDTAENGKHSCSGCDAVWYE